MVNDDGSMVLEKTYKNIKYRVSSTECLKRSIWDCRDRILNSEGREFTKTRREWYNLFKRFENLHN